MPLIRLGEPKDVPHGDHYTLDTFIEMAEAGGNQSVIRLLPDDDPLRLEPYLDKLEVIEISFPKYTDGRGYSQAQLLRRRLGYRGELRAVGDVLRDQLLFMYRSGFDAFEVDRADAVEAFEAALKEYSVFNQPAADDQMGVFARRHASD